LLGGKGVYGLRGQDSVGLAQPFPQPADGLVRLFLGCVEDPFDSGFEVGGSALYWVLIRVVTDMLTMSDVRSVTADIAR
jgi:hypothetical protein